MPSDINKKIFGYKLVKQKFGRVQNKKMLGVVMNRDFSFNEYVSSLCKKAGRKLSVLSRLLILRAFNKEDF